MSSHWNSLSQYLYTDFPPNHDDSIRRVRLSCTDCCASCIVKLQAWSYYSRLLKLNQLVARGAALDQESATLGSHICWPSLSLSCWMSLSDSHRTQRDSPHLHLTVHFFMETFLSWGLPHIYWQYMDLSAKLWYLWMLNSCSQINLFSCLFFLLF